MNRRSIIWLVVVGAVLVAVPALAQKRGRGAQAGPTVFSLQINNAAPGIDAVLALTAEQKEKIVAAANETVQSEPVVAARKVRTDENATDEQKKQARKRVQDAEAKFAEKLGAILTTEQKALYDKVNVAFAEVRKAAGKVGATGRQERQAKLRAEFGKKLDGILTAEQKAAMAKAAAAKGGKKRGGGGGGGGKKAQAAEDEE